VNFIKGVILLANPTKQDGVWSFIGLSILYTILITICMIVILVAIGVAFEDRTSVLYRIITVIIMFIGSIIITFLTVHFYAKTRIVTKEVIKNISWVFFILFALYLIHNATALLNFPERRDTVGIIGAVYNFVTAPVVIILMRNLLFRKMNAQQETLKEETENI
jgi:hypothetical protein